MNATEQMPVLEEKAKIEPAQQLPEQAETRTESFAKGFGFYKLFWVFFIGCFLGVVIETIWCIATRHVIESRSGLVYGPFNLVYGFGALFMTLSLHWLSKKRDLYIFLGGAVIGGVFEYICSWIQEMMFGTVSWEYSNMPFNVNGRTSLLYSLFWGILALLWVKNGYPAMERVIEKIPNRWGKSLTWVLLIFMIVNTIMSAVAVSRWSERRMDAAPPNAFCEWIDKRFPDARMEGIYPNMQFEQYPQKDVENPS